MKIGLGLPSTIAGTSGSLVLEWARKADARGFSSVCAIDRVAYPNYDPLVALTAAAAVTERVLLYTAILLAPLRANHAQFARQIGSIEAISNGRLVLGLGAGSRREDYDLSGVEFSRRGRLFDELLETSTSIWRGEKGAIGPALPRPEGPPLYFGGESAPALRRAARWGSGWIAGGGGPEEFAENVEKVQAAFEMAGRAERPRTVKLGYFALGHDAEHFATQTLGSYYAFRGPERVKQIIASSFLSEEAVLEGVVRFATVNCDELIFVPTNPDLSQVDRLAEVLELA